MFIIIIDCGGMRRSEEANKRERRSNSTTDNN
jgi:hypothetical protein